MTEEQLSALLRVKRHEQPPPRYFERLLQDIHRRQRSELLQRPLWEIALERVQTFFSEHSMGNRSYAAAMVVALVGGVGAIFLATPGEIERKPGVAIAAAANGSPQSKLLSLQSIGPALPAAFNPQATSPNGARTVKERRYVIDARPVSYEPEPSTRF